MNGENRAVGISDKWMRDIFIGIILAVAFYIFGKVFGIVGVVGIPSVPQSIAQVLGNIGLFLVICVLAPIFETVIFQEFVLEFFDIKLFNAPYLLASIFSSILFVIFHALSYSNLNASLGAYVSVFVVGMTLCYMRKYFNSLMPLITFHATLNFIAKFIIELQWIKF